ncbi:MAG: ABC transporter substrate-binding protein [Prolixibacteraceae bacterium]|nr:ABC transporter substrate-binding protein [Prolixibacteraceae bacterium]
MYFFIILLSIISVVTGCSGTGKDPEITKSSNNYARGFRIEKNDRITKLTVFNPWEQARNVSMEYFLVSKDDDIPVSVTGKRVIRTPVKRTICLSTTHLAFLNAINESASVVGISGNQYVSDTQIREGIEDGRVQDVGYGQNLNYELIIKLKPELVMVYGVGSEVAGYTQKLEELGIPVIMIAEYLEESPLGKAEWLLFIAELFEKSSLAHKYYLNVQEQYSRMREIAKMKKSKPRVLVGSPYKDTWWIPGGKSYMANLIADAGGDYLGKKNSSHESYVISFENALALSSKAEIWLNTGSMSSKSEIVSFDERFKNFRVLKEGKIYNNIKRVSPAGGNDFWESGTVNPHKILHDLISIFHPGLIDGELNYYIELK